MTKRKREIIVLLFCIVGGSSVSSQQRPMPSEDFERTKQEIRHALRAQVTLAGHKLAVLEREATQLELEIDQALRLLSNLKNTDSASAEPPNRESQPARESRDISYRPPLAHISFRESVNFICREGRVMHVDFATINRTLNKVRSEQSTTIRAVIRRAATEGHGETEFDIAAGNFNVRFVVTRDEQGRTRQQLELVSKPGVQGEDIAQIGNPRSQFMRALSASTPAKSDVQFTVFPDSFDVFRQARSLAWEQRYEVGWFPKVSGKPIKLGGGGVSITN